MTPLEKPIFLKNKEVHRILDEVIESIPTGCSVYLHGGALRNSVYCRLFNEEMTQRDFDMIVVGEKEPFVSNMLAKGFIYGKKNTDTAVVLKKPRHENPSEDFADWVYLDIVFRPNDTIEDSLKQKVNFTINGSAIDLAQIHDQDWFDKLVVLPDTLKDLKSKQLRTNTRYPINIYACVRFVSRGFKPPSKKEVADMIEDVRNIEPHKFEMNRKKVIDYVGSEEGVRTITKKLGIPFDILELDAIKSKN